MQHRPRDAVAEGAKISTGGLGELREQNRFYVVAAFSGGAFVFVSIFIAACLLSFHRNRRIRNPIPLQHSTSGTSPTPCLIIGKNFSIQKYFIYQHNIVIIIYDLFVSVLYLSVVIQITQRDKIWC